MPKTYIELVNLVHGFMRHDTDETALDADEDTIIAANFINEAKREVEDHWKWNALRATVTFDSVVDQTSYDTSSLAVVSSDPTVTTERSELLEDPETGMPLFWDVTSGGEFRLKRRTREHVIAQLRLDPNSVATPGFFAMFNNGSGLTVLLREVPSAVRSYSCEVYTPQAELSAAADTLTCPWRPVMLRATALAKGEIGEEFSGPSTNYQSMFTDALETDVAREKDEADLTLRLE